MYSPNITKITSICNLYGPYNIVKQAYQTKNFQKLDFSIFATQLAIQFMWLAYGCKKAIQEVIITSSIGSGCWVLFVAAFFLMKFDKK